MIARPEQEATLRRAFPQCRITRAQALAGGISSNATLYELVLADGTERRVVVRRPPCTTGDGAPGPSAAEYEVLRVARSSGVLAPEPCFLDPDGRSLVLEYVEGAPDLQVPFDISKLHRAAAQLAGIHRVRAPDHDLSFLPDRWESARTLVENWPIALDGSLDEANVRTTLAALWPWRRRNQDVLLHGDYWPGNLIWREDRIAAIIDWEEAERGDPLADLAIARLDMLWAFGVEAVHEFTRHYASLTDIDWTALPYWDLFVTLRPMSNLARWASSYALAPVNRPDIDEIRMREGHRWFVEHALQRLPRR
jgi:aminoglycoside phosphotransferase (APT) family kinase protein